MPSLHSGIVAAALILACALSFEGRAQQPVEAKPGLPTFWNRFIFTGGTSVVLPIGDFKEHLSPAFSAATGLDFALGSTVFLGLTGSYNRHGFSSNTLYPGIKLESNTELLSLFLNGRFTLGPARWRLSPYVFAGPGVAIVTRPAIEPGTRPGDELTVTKTNETKLLGNVGGGLDIKINPMLILYVETGYNTSFSGSQVQFVPVLLGLRTYPADFFKKK